MAPRTAGGHCQGRAELRDDTSSARAQTKGSPHSRKSSFFIAPNQIEKLKKVLNFATFGTKNMIDHK
jgi:hypothetical protein